VGLSTAVPGAVQADRSWHPEYPLDGHHEHIRCRIPCPFERQGDDSFALFRRFVTFRACLAHKKLREPDLAEKLPEAAPKTNSVLFALGKTARSRGLRIVFTPEGA